MKKFIIFNTIYVLYPFALYFVWLMFAMIDKNNNDLSLNNLFENIFSNVLVSFLFLVPMAIHFASILLLIFNLFLYLNKRKMILFKAISLIQLLNLPTGIFICIFNLAFYYSDDSIDLLK